MYPGHRVAVQFTISQEICTDCDTHRDIFPLLGAKSHSGVDKNVFERGNERIVPTGVKDPRVLFRSLLHLQESWGDEASIKLKGPQQIYSLSPFEDGKAPHSEGTADVQGLDGQMDLMHAYFMILVHNADRPLLRFMDSECHCNSHAFHLASLVLLQFLARPWSQWQPHS